MTLQWTRREFEECKTCAAKGGSPALCHECLERRELYGVLEQLRRFPGLMLLPGVAKLITVCPTCDGEPDPECKEHGR